MLHDSSSNDCNSHVYHYNCLFSSNWTHQFHMMIICADRGRTMILSADNAHVRNVLVPYLINWWSNVIQVVLWLLPDVAQHLRKIKGTFVYDCLYFRPKLWINFIPNVYTLPHNVSELNYYTTWLCVKRQNGLHSDCIDGPGPSFTSLGFECSNCTGHWYRVTLYILLELVPITVLIVMTFAPMTGNIVYTQNVLYELLIWTSLCQIVTTNVPNSQPKQKHIDRYIAMHRLGYVPIKNEKSEDLSPMGLEQRLEYLGYRDLGL